MTTRTLNTSQWKPYFDRVSKNLPATAVDLHVESADLGDQVLFENGRLVGFDYDPNDRAIEVVTPEGSHRVTAPKSVSVEESAEGLHAVEIVDDEGRQHIVRLHRALALPPS